MNRLTPRAGASEHRPGARPPAVLPPGSSRRRLHLESEKSRGTECAFLPGAIAECPDGFVAHRPVQQGRTLTEESKR